VKIIVICQYYYPEPFKVNDFCEELVKLGHEITVLTGLPNYPSGIIKKEYKKLKKRREKINGVNVIRSFIIGRGKGNFSLALNYISYIISASIKVLFLKRDFDLVFVYQLSPVTMAIPGIILKKIIKKRLVLYCFDLWPESVISGNISRVSKIYSILLKISKWIYKNSDQIIISSKNFKKYFNNTLGIKKELIHLPIYAENLFSNIPNINSSDINLVFAGNIGEMQSIETIIYAANEIKNNKNIFIHIVGDGTSREKCENIVRQMNLKNVIFHGAFPINEMPQFYKLADAFLLTLKKDEILSYTLPGKVQTYMASGKPIIAAINGEARFIIEDAKCGLCSPAEDYMGLAKSIIEFSNDKDKYSGYGGNAKKYYEQNFSKANFFKNLNKLLLDNISN